MVSIIFDTLGFIVLVLVGFINRQAFREDLKVFFLTEAKFTHKH